MRRETQSHSVPGEHPVILERLLEPETDDPGKTCDSTIPAGYTYLGQFIDHDVSRGSGGDEPTHGSAFDPQMRDERRSPRLVLDSVYGNGPSGSPELFEADGRSLQIGSTSPVQGLPTFPNDLPRWGSDATGDAKPTDAKLGDPRSDENLAVAQTHLAFLKFHNARAAASPGASFEEVRHEVVLHYQAILLTDFLPRIARQDILGDVLESGHMLYTGAFEDIAPFELSVAAYRIGHSMMRPSYEWNRIFNTSSPRGAASMADLVEFSGVGCTRGAGTPLFLGLPTLPSNWIVDWRRMYEIPDGGALHPQLNRARKLDAGTGLGRGTLHELQDRVCTSPPPRPSLANRAPRRDRQLLGPTGQQVANALGVPALTPGELVEGIPAQQAAQVSEPGFADETPLWHYILREAMMTEDGDRLGQVGSRVVAEAIVGLIEHSETNVLAHAPGLTFSMREMLLEVNDINPLG